MRIAAISDIHSNVFALEAVLADIQRKNVDVIVNLGDILYGPIAPKATYELLIQHDIVTIRGNQDRQIYEATAKEINDNPTLQFILDDLGEQPLAWMKGLPFSFQLTPEVFLCHGTPEDDLIYLLEDVDSGNAKLRNDRDILALVGDQSSQVILCGHTHTPRTVTISSGQLIVNPGSVGLPAYTDDEPILHSMETYSPHASYALLDSSGNQWNVEHIKVAYAYEQAVKQASMQGRKDWVHFLSTGRGL